MKIYTKTGDKGQTSIIGKRIAKNNKLINFLGKLDELNCTLGIVISFTQEKTLIDKIVLMQNKIFEISSKVSGVNINCKLDNTISQLESDIDLWTSELPELKNFILPGGSQSASFAHLARAVCRECERIFFDILSNELTKSLLMDSGLDEHDAQSIGIFLNRFSDWLFTLARKLNNTYGVVDIVWKL